MIANVFIILSERPWIVNYLERHTSLSVLARKLDRMLFCFILLLTSISIAKAMPKDQFVIVETEDTEDTSDNVGFDGDFKQGNGQVM